MSCVFLFSHAQTKFRFNNYTINDGLSQSSVTTIIQDDLSSLWIGTQDGLNRFDGHSFEVFTSDKTEGLESEFILSSIKDKDGDLWFGTNHGLTIYHHKKEKFESYFIGNGDKQQINDLLEDNKGNIWLSTLASGLFKFNKKSKKFTSYSTAFSTLRIKNIEITEKGLIVVSTEDLGVFLFNPFQKTTTKISYFSEKKITINLIRALEKNKLFFACNNGVFEYNLSTKRVNKKFDYLNRKYGSQNISDLYFDSEIGWLLSTNDNGLFIVQNDGKISHSTEDIFQKDALLFNVINTLFKDESGTFWIGSQRGISSFNPLSKSFIGIGPSALPEKGIPTPSVWSFSEDEQYLYIGTDKAVSRMDKKTGVFRQFYRTKDNKSGIREMAILSLQAISKNKIIAGCADGLFILNITKGSYSYERITGSNANKHNRIYSTLHWKKDKYWLATKDGALLFNSKTNTIEAFEYSVKDTGNTISKGICRMVFKDNNNSIWFATSTGGLNILSEKNNEIIIKPYVYNHILKKISKESIASMYQDDSGLYWLGTIGDGLIRWDATNKKANIFNKSNGLPNNVVYAVIPGKENTLWLSTNKGLSELNYRTNQVKNYTEIDGLMSNEFNLGAHMKSKSGDIYFGGIYGYNYFNPNNLVSNKKDVSVVFTKFRLENDKDEEFKDEEPIFLKDEVLLDYNQRSFTIRFQPTDLSQPELLNYKYQLEGSDEGEIIIGSQNEIHFNSLSHGDYTLKVYARLGEGKWSSYPAEIKIGISPPFWLTWPFIAFSVLFIALFVRFIIKKRVADARREQVQLEIKINERTREIKTQNKKIELQKKKLEKERNTVILQQKELQKEKDKTERLLKNIIPESTADELKKKGKARARSYKKVSVLFTDFIGFSKISDEMTASELVKKLDVYFTKFDEIIIKNNLEKIKTIGDAYMCAGGVPVRNTTNPIDTVTAALQIQAYMQKRMNDAIANDRDYWELRLGINTGEVTAGVIGSERLAFDIWGATVNRAQRMEMHGQPGKVTISGATYTNIEPYFECRYAGKAQTKSRDMMEMYVVERIKPELSIKGEGIVPNDKFHKIVNLHHYSSINYYKAERHIVRVLEQQLSENLHYHSIAHTKDVVNAVERLALAENVTDEGLFLLKSAATYHDAGFVEQYEKNEYIGARMAEEILPLYGYTLEHIEKIKELIYVTEIPHKPKNNLEEIICDADLDYLGRDDFHTIASRLCKELIEHGKIENEKQWDEIQVQFLTKHKYFTKTAKRTRRKKKLENLQEIKEKLKRDNYK